MLKKIVYVVVALVVLLIAAVIAVTQIDVNRFKPDIEAFAQERWQRTLTLDGDLQLKLFPRLAVALPKIRLSAPNKPDTIEIRLDSAQVGLAILPLFQGRIAVGRIEVNGPEVELERAKDGRLSLADLWTDPDAAPEASAPADASGPAGETSGKPASEPAAGGAPDSGSGAPGLPGWLRGLDLAGVEVVDGYVNFHDRQAGSHAEIRGILLKVGRIAAQGSAPVEFAADLRLEPQQLRLHAAGSTTLGHDLAAGTFDLQELAFLVTGSQAGAPLSLEVKLPSLTWAQGVAQAAQGQIVTKLQDGAVTARSDFKNLRFDPTALKLEALNVKADLAQGDRQVQMQLGTPVQGNLASGEWQMPTLAGTIDIQDPALPEGRASIQLTGDARADLNGQTARARLQARADGIDLDTQADVKGFSPPRLTVALKSESLDIDRYFPPAAKPAGESGGSTPAPQDPAPPATPEGAQGSADDTPIDLSVLHALDLDARVDIGLLKVRRLEARSIDVRAHMGRGRLDVTTLKAGLYGGTLDGKAQALAKGGVVGAQIHLQKVPVLPILQAVADVGLLEGTGEVDVDIRGAGTTVGALKRSLDGNGKVQLRDGSIRGINLAQTLRSAGEMFKGVLAGKPPVDQTERSDSALKTDFTSLGLSFVMKDGVATSRDLDVRSPLLRVSGDGTVDVGAGRLDYLTRVAVVASTSGQDGRSLDDLRGVTVPIRLTGPFAALDWKIDWKTAGQEALKSRVTGQAQERVEQEAKKLLESDKARQILESDKAKQLLGDDPAGKLQNSLKGLFGQ